MFTMSSINLSWATILIWAILVESAPPGVQRLSPIGDGSGEPPLDVLNSGRDRILTRGKFGDQVRSSFRDDGFFPNDLDAASRPLSVDPDFPVMDLDEGRQNVNEDENTEPHNVPADDDDAPYKVNPFLYEPERVQPHKDDDAMDKDDGNNDNFNEEDIEPNADDNKKHVDRGSNDDDDDNEDEKSNKEDDKGHDSKKPVDDDVADAEEVGPSLGFNFDTSFFNWRQVTKYFQELEKSLEHVFRETLGDTIPLNSTYVNTTEEEVEIDGKKFIVQKSIIKGKDDNSSIYVESLSTVPKRNEIKVASDKSVKCFKTP